MFLLLAQVVLWLLIALLLWYLLWQAAPKNSAFWFVRLIVVLTLIAAFFFPADPFSQFAWGVLSLPLKPVGLSVVLLIVASRQYLWVESPPKTRKFTVRTVRFKKEKPGKVIVRTVKSEEEKPEQGIVRTVKSKQVWAALLILLVFSNPWIALQLEEAVSRQGLDRSALCLEDAGERKPTQTAGAIVVLGRTVTQPGLRYGTQMQVADTSERILAAFQQYRQQRELGNRPLVIVSAGMGSVGGARRTEADAMLRLLDKLGVKDIRFDDNSFDIYSSALEVKKIFTQQAADPKQQIILVASTLDVGRAKLTFERVGLGVVPNSIDLYERVCQAFWQRVLFADFVPSAQALMRSERSVNEFFTLIYYFLRGWLALAVA
ncbi:MAG: YdcF family protein [Oscillatoria sp. Prado101]|jgi:uncharacterized SAM-binding protein YcdF (DUF218 family)|nr:YdcF family protein [Oscillatoria sp. Prado101]